jgi:hypothetical protein
MVNICIFTRVCVCVCLCVCVCVYIYVCIHIYYLAPRDGKGFRDFYLSFGHQVLTVADSADHPLETP